MNSHILWATMIAEGGLPLHRYRSDPVKALGCNERRWAGSPNVRQGVIQCRPKGDACRFPAIISGKYELGGRLSCRMGGGERKKHEGGAWLVRPPPSLRRHRSWRKYQVKLLLGSLDQVAQERANDRDFRSSQQPVNHILARLDFPRRFKWGGDIITLEKPTCMELTRNERAQQHQNPLLDEQEVASYAAYNSSLHRIKDFYLSRDFGRCHM
ncbi:hypothetical protein VNO77_41890 [Canavalia gladiata]|uniref:Uncharacterized protein n=1 Tax=Canavalia gladiata TaxID=3824 RepID=A0AAN9K0M1_CANGL